MHDALRCKLRVTQITQHKNATGELEAESITLAAVTTGGAGDENAQWSKWTPFAEFKLSVTNPAAYGFFSQGHEFYVDLSPAQRS